MRPARSSDASPRSRRRCAAAVPGGGEDAVGQVVERRSRCRRACRARSCGDPCRSAGSSPRASEVVDRLGHAAGAEGGEQPPGRARRGRASSAAAAGERGAVPLGEQRRRARRPAPGRSAASTASSTLRKPWCSKPVAGSVWRTAWCSPAVHLNGHAARRRRPSGCRPARPRRGTARPGCRRCGTSPGSGCRPARRAPRRAAVDRGSSTSRRHGAAGARRSSTAARPRPPRPGRRRPGPRPPTQLEAAGRLRDRGPPRPAGRRPHAITRDVEPAGRRRGARELVQPGAGTTNGPTSRPQPVRAAPAVRGHRDRHRGVAGREQRRVVEQPVRTEAWSCRRPPARPGPGVAAVVGGGAALAEVERAEGVDHDGELVEELGAERASTAPGCGPCEWPPGCREIEPLPMPEPLRAS